MKTIKKSPLPFEPVAVPWAEDFNLLSKVGAGSLGVDSTLCKTANEQRPLNTPKAFNDK